ncbi:hypothetical protein KS4_35750 [Poriferisphaera corsica]|uniref:Uncharacterized protein n=1 Tax=Poriferisphaera corsica TaxID=2528020 RepID=A0A517YZ41_9BACT|nr:hypothetical protein [Poriferisphaera corsica]QDU35492.1 hypothetical protein KS4_35750 [Poriferisphaera corsica]
MLTVLGFTSNTTCRGLAEINIITSPSNRFEQVNWQTNNSNQFFIDSHKRITSHATIVQTSSSLQSVKLTPKTAVQLGSLSIRCNQSSRDDQFSQLSVKINLYFDRPDKIYLNESIPLKDLLNSLASNRPHQFTQTMTVNNVTYQVFILPSHAITSRNAISLMKHQFPQSQAWFDLPLNIAFKPV